MAGYSKAHGFVRLYPTRMDSPLRAWNIVSVPVERNERDTRTESWKIKGSKYEWGTLSDRIEVIGQVGKESRLPFVKGLVSRCVADLVDEDRSLGIVRPRERTCRFERRSKHEPGVQTTLFGASLPRDKRGYELQPRIRYRCSGCRKSNGHDQQVLEWGVYEWMRKHPGEEEDVWKNLFGREDRQEILFLVGNQARWHGSFMIVSILRIPADRMRGQRSLMVNPL
ncbi:MAG: hypothetical protein A3K67_07215 [Euryarchaeota archaeon RBG_16_62_10]|nr:MAG: hypothetical protein A3K67_07215 [Euryarchaeota archaeon RBG_16_62_10]